MNKTQFENTVNLMNSNGLIMNELFVYENGTIFSHCFNNFSGETNIRSISKPITCLCFGIAIDLGYFKQGLDEKVYQYLVKTQKIYKENNKNIIKNWTIKTLLTLTIGFEEKMLHTKHIATLTDENYGDVVLNAELHHEPGEFFIYSNAAMYLASIVFENATNISLEKFVNKYIFSKLDIPYTKWKQSPQGYAMGCTGIEMSGENLLKIGELFLNDGKYNGKQIVSSSWIKEMKVPQVLTPEMYDVKRVLPKYAYGLNMWVCEDGIYYCDGTDGQYLIIVPAKNMVIVTTGCQSNMKPITECLKNIIRN